MKKYYSSKERKLRSLMKTVAIVSIVLFLFVIAVLVFSKGNDKTVTYTPEQLKHDHDGDGIPDH